jgi:hypothetical protein
LKFYKAILIALVVATGGTYAQNVSLNDTVHLVYGALTYNGQTIFVTDNGLQVTQGDTHSSQSTNEQFSQYYKMIYGKDAENPNYVIDGENMGFVPFVNINELYGNGTRLIDGVSVSDFAKAVSDKNFPKRKEVLNKIENYAKNLTKKK